MLINPKTIVVLRQIDKKQFLTIKRHED